jgi:hypothetical protein
MPPMLDRYYAAIIKEAPAHLPAQLHSMEIDEAARYFYTNDQQSSWDISLDFDCVLPLYPGTWMEYRVPAAPQTVGIWKLYQEQGITACGCMSWVEPMPAARTTRAAALRADVLVQRMWQDLAKKEAPTSDTGMEDALQNRQAAIRRSLARDSVPRYLGSLIK